MGRALTRAGFFALLFAAMAGSSIAAATGSSSFPAATYPVPVASHGGALTACPNPAGLEPLDTQTAKRAVRVASGFGLISLADDLRNSDRAYWPQVRSMWRSRIKPSGGVVNTEVYGSAPAPRSGYAVIVRFSCGAKLVAESLTVGVGPRQTHAPYCEACISHAFVLDRRGRVLVYYVH